MAKKQVKQNGKISLAEFKAWLQGVEDMQSDDWHPDSIQWKRIREKIELIEFIETNTPRQNVAPVKTQPAQPQPQRQVIIPPTGTTLPVTPLRVNNTQPPMATGEGSQVKTPDIDTSHGQYQSTFI